MMTAALSVLAAVLLDGLLGEPKHWHPLVGFGRLANRAEQVCYGAANLDPRDRHIRGILALVLLLVPVVTITLGLTDLPYAGAVFSVAALYLALGHRSLHEHARPVDSALESGDQDRARRLVGRMVSRDSAALDIPGAVLYRLANTLDAMWGYRNERYRHFGWAAARLDDVLNYIPARLTAITYALLGNTRLAFWCWRTQAPAWDSPNAGPVMAAGAGALGLSIGGPARYLGEWHQRPVLGAGAAPTRRDIERALRLVRHGVGLWLGVLLTGGLSLA